MPHFMIVFIQDIYLLNLSWIIERIFFNNMESFMSYVVFGGFFLALWDKGMRS